jgi:signal transduction histidine kinase
MNIKASSSKLNSKERRIVEDRIKDIAQQEERIRILLNLFDFKNLGDEFVGLNMLIRNITKFFLYKKGTIIHFDLAGLSRDEINLMCNKAELSMILYNIISNAVYAIESNEKDAKIEIVTRKDEKYVRIEIRDNGIGIDKDFIEEIYYAGFSKRENGLGIGLYFVKETLEQSFKGTIDCESQYNHWTKFIIQIPH